MKITKTQGSVTQGSVTQGSPRQASVEMPPKSSLDLFKLMGGQARKVEQPGTAPVDSMLAVYKDRFTYTFIFSREVASIHFDRGRGEIFFKGHNLKHSPITQPQREALERVRNVLENDPRGGSLKAEYEATLAKLLAEKKE